MVTLHPFYQRRETCLTSHTRPISHHITPLTINTLEVDTQTHILTSVRTKAISRNQVHAKAARAWFTNTRKYHLMKLVYPVLFETYSNVRISKILNFMYF